jgi:hypothetical protein
MLGKAPDMNRKSWINRMLLAGASALAMTVASAEAGATTFDFTGSLVSWTVPTNGVYVTTAYGAQGGSNLGAGGLGAEAGGYIPLSAGTMLAVIAGGEGALEAGGGGSFVFNITDGSYLVAAGGGGGSGFSLNAGGPGLVTTAGGDGVVPGITLVPGGVDGMGGTGGEGGGGAGVLSGGSTGAGFGAPGITSYGGASKFGSPGGFGGGGGGDFGAGGGTDFGGGGGGGGFGGVGGGGGSFLSPLSGLADRVLLAGVNSGNGYVTIDLDGTTAIPEPSHLGADGGRLCGLRPRRPAASMFMRHINRTRSGDASMDNRSQAVPLGGGSAGAASRKCGFCEREPEVELLV